MANNRYNKAVDEFNKCQDRMIALQEEIPKLEEMARVIEDYIQGRRSLPPEATVSTFAPVSDDTTTGQPRAEIPAAISALVPPHLQKFVNMHPSQIRNMPSQAQGGAVRAKVGAGDDAFLPEPTGTEILP